MTTGKSPDGTVDQPEKKTCPMCCGELPVAAKRCPHCQHFQHKLFTLPFEHPRLMLIPVALILFLFITAISIPSMMLKSLADDGEDYADHRYALGVFDPQVAFGMKQGRDDTYETVVVLAEIRNTSEITWTDIRLEAKAFDAAGQLTDVEHEREHCLIIPPHGEATVKVVFARQFPKEKYATCSVRVTGADEKGPY
jgi:hypothetical protein